MLYHPTPKYFFHTFLYIVNLLLMVYSVMYMSLGSWAGHVTQIDLYLKMVTLYCLMSDEEHVICSKHHGSVLF